ncbi:hypothetical protein BJP34_20665 [Moorena producens PAL-8-15-08-1]|uniref:Uncharacterized protein n=1 Tax=Moorena producens PAL-8-15-08-1 TaxID=1458985 RepID=A0A1D8TVG8_9CYAN|nr:hypothetical protein [Moorena producens]AOX01533.1 hypothetical protein BJP34_20665 [Moorena producens PAL-8-15-08-1]
MDQMHCPPDKEKILGWAVAKGIGQLDESIRCTAHQTETTFTKGDLPKEPLRDSPRQTRHEHIFLESYPVAYGKISRE